MMQPNPALIVSTLAKSLMLFSRCAAASLVSQDLTPHYEPSCHGDPRMPSRAWDSHLHVMDPDRYPTDPEIPYTPGVYTVWDNAIFENSIGCEHVLFVQTATHGFDMTLMLDSLRAYGSHARGVALFDPNTITTDELHEWHELGVRGVRVNLVTYADEVPIEELKDQINEYVDLIRPLDWVLQLYVKMETVPLLEDFLPTLGVKVVFDHYGNPVLPDPTNSTGPVVPSDIKGFDSLVRLLQGGKTWVKISGAYRFSHLEGNTWEDVDPLTLALFEAGPSRVIFGSDWPHTRFDGLNIKPWVEHILDLTEGNQALREGLFRDNARELWGVKDSEPARH